MAIRFVDKGPEDDRDRKATPARPKHPARTAVAPDASLEHDASAAEPAEAGRVGLSADSLPSEPMPEPKVRGRKGHTSRAAVPAVEPVQVPLEGMLPSLPHAKPEPKPRGRKKAFG